MESALLGNRTNLKEAQAKAHAASRAAADAFAANVLPVIEKIRASGATSLRAIAAELEARNIRTARDGTWSAVQVRDLLGRGAA